MDWKQFIAAIIASVAWPGVAAAFLVLLGPTLVKIVQRLAHLKYKDLELDFDKIKIQVEELPEGTPKRDEPRPSIAVTSLEDQILDAVERAPSAAILLAWSGLETAIASAVARLAISPESPSYRSPRHNIEILEKHTALSSLHSDLLHEMRMLRNKVAHNPDSMRSVTQEQALNYAHAAIGMMNHLEKLQNG